MWALDLTYPTSAEVISTPFNGDTYPSSRHRRSARSQEIYYDGPNMRITNALSATMDQIAAVTRSPEEGSPPHISLTINFSEIWM